MNKKSIALFGLALFSLAFTAFGNPNSSKEQEFLALHGLNGKTTVQMINYIDQLPQKRPLPFSASITSTDLKLSDGKETYIYTLDGDLFYISFAPYINRTHPCFNHSLSGCQGEMVEKTFEVTIKDQTGKVILADKLTSYRNGFIGVWLPRDTTGVIEVNYEGLKGSAAFSTLADSQTCLTTLKLERKP